MPKKARAIVLFGAKREDHVKIVQGWEKDRKVEDGQGEWSCPSFVVYHNLKPRGVEEYRNLNEATLADSYPCPG